MTRPEAPECLPQETLFRLWRGPGGVWGRAAEQHPYGIEWSRPLRFFPQASAGNPECPSPLSRKDKVGASVVPREYPGSG